MAIDITGANAYFGATIETRSESWTRIPLAQRIAAVAQAKDLIQRRLADPIVTDTTVVRDFPRHDAAVYEQAFWILQTTALTSSVNAVPFDPKQGISKLVADARAMQSLNTMITPAAWGFLVVDRNGRLSRG